MSVVFRKNQPEKHARRTGKAIAIDQRTGFKHLQKDMVFESGTNYYVHKQESDGRYNLVDHPQNYRSAKLDRPERIALRHPSPDTPLFIGVVISADQLGLPSHASTFYSSTVWPSVGVGVCVAPSAGTGVCVGGAIFSNAANSQYILVIFQGI